MQQLCQTSLNCAFQRVFVGVLQMCHHTQLFRVLRGCNGLPFYFEFILYSSEIFQKTGLNQVKHVTCTQLEFNVLFSLFFSSDQSCIVAKYFHDICVHDACRCSPAVLFCVNKLVHLWVSYRPKQQVRLIAQGWKMRVNYICVRVHTLIRNFICKYIFLNENAAQNVYSQDVQCVCV